MKVDFIGVGFAKCGTTTVSRLLEEHPDICFSVPKEIQYFNSHYQLSESSQKINPNSKKSINWYLNHWSHRKSETIMGEFSPQYILKYETGVRIKNTFPDVKIIICLRHPQKAIFSYYNFLKNYLSIELEELEVEMQTNPKMKALLHYSDYIENYLKIFGKENIHFFVLENFIKNPEVEIKNLYHFLKVDDSFVPPSLHKKFNASKKTLFPFLVKLEKQTIRFFSAIGMTGFIIWLKKIGISKLVHSLHMRKASFGKIENSDKAYIQEFVNKEIPKLSKMINIDLDCWVEKK